MGVAAASGRPTLLRSRPNPRPRSIPPLWLHTKLRNPGLARDMQPPHFGAQLDARVVKQLVPPLLRHDLKLHGPRRHAARARRSCLPLRLLPSLRRLLLRQLRSRAPLLVDHRLLLAHKLRQLLARLTQQGVEQLAWGRGVWGARMGACARAQRDSLQRTSSRCRMDARLATPVAFSACRFTASSARSALAVDSAETTTPMNLRSGRAPRARKRGQLQVGERHAAVVQCGGVRCGVVRWCVVVCGVVWGGAGRCVGRRTG